MADYPRDYDNMTEQQIKDARRWYRVSPPPRWWPVPTSGGQLRARARAEQRARRHAHRRASSKGGSDGKVDAPGRKAE